MNEYEIPTATGVRTVTANSKVEALGPVPNAKLKSPNVITSDTLKSTPKANTALPPVVSNASGYSAELTATNVAQQANQDAQDALTVQTNKETADRQAQLAKSTKEIGNFLGNQQGETELTDTAYSQKNILGTTVDETSKALKNITAKINAVDIRANEQIKQIQKNTQGLFGGALQQEIDKVNRQAFSDKADLYIEKLVAQGDFDSAKSIADRQVAIKLEQDKQKLEALKFQYENNKDLFTTSEQRQFELSLTDRQNAYEEKQANLKTISDLSLDALQNGAPPLIASQMRSAKTVEEAMQIGGQYVGLLGRQTKQAQLDKIYSDIKENSTLSNGFLLPNIGGEGTIGSFIPDTNLAASQKQKVNTVVAGVDLINQAEKLYKEAVGDEYEGFGSGVLSRLKGVGRATGGFIGTNEKWKTYQNFLDSNRAPIAKGIKGEVGNLAEQEQKNALKSFPTAFSSPYEAKNAFSTIRNQAQSNVRTLGTLDVVETKNDNQTNLSLSPDQYQELKDLGLIQ